jgi:type IV pilus biogenesis protein CpaD/CtpE
MKRILIAAALALSLGGCAQLQAISTGISLSQASIANPVTKTKEGEIELAINSAIVVLNTYKRACIAGTADKNCKDNIRQVQAYTRQIKPLVAQLRNFVDANDQINAVVVFNQLTTLYTNFKAAATSLGVNLGSAA